MANFKVDSYGQSSIPGGRALETTCRSHGMDDSHLKMPGNQKYHTGQPEALHHKLILGQRCHVSTPRVCAAEVGKGMSIMDQLLVDDE